MATHTIRTMKTSFYKLPSVSLICTLATVYAAHAAPVADSSSQLDYLFKAKDLSKIAIGAYVMGIQRKVDTPAASGTKMDAVRSMGYLSYHVLPWLSVYGAMGAGEYELNDVGTSSGTDGQWGFGVRANLLDHFIKDPTLLEHRIELRSGANYTAVDTKLGGRSEDWGEFSASLTLHLVNEIVGNKELMPTSIGLYVGPVYSTYLGGDVEEDTSVGVSGGMEIVISENISLGLGVEYFDNATAIGSIDIRF
jgi:opacity protein-like surface antigen